MIYFSTATQGRARISGPLADAVQTLLDRDGARLIVDGRFGPASARAMNDWQARNGFPSSPTFSEDQWQRLSALGPLTAFDRVLNPTVAFEGTYFTGVVGAFDSGGLTWGILGFTLSSGALQELFSDIETRAPGLIAGIFGAEYGQLMQALPLRGQAAVDWAKTISTGANNTQLVAPWAGYFSALGGRGAAKAVQMDHAFATWFGRAVGYIDRYMPGRQVSLLDIAFWFDVAVQTGVSSAVSTDLLAVDMTGLDNAACRAAFAQVIANHAAAQWRNDVLSRKMTFATGRGTVHGAVYDLADWGITDDVVPAPDTETRPVLSTMFSAC
ncbi:hypothetical protein [Tistrella mobilis]